MENRYALAVYDCLDNLLAYGTDHYGPVPTGMLMSIIDVRTHSAPEDPQLFEAHTRSEGRPGRRNPGGIDLWEDQPLLGVMYQASKRRNDPRYSAAADAYVRDFFIHARKPNGMLAWGSHLWFDPFRQEIRDDCFGRHHEPLVYLAQWEDMWRVNERVVREEIEGMWQWHIVDKQTGQFNRHDDGLLGCDFAYSAGPMIHAFAFMAAKTGDQTWKERAKILAGWHWRHRDPKTNLVPEAPSTCPRYDSYLCFSTVPGPHAAALLGAFELTGDAFFRDTALAYIKAWLRYAWDENAGQFYAALKLDGTPIPDQAKGEGYDMWLPTGHADTWPTTMFSYDMPLAAAQTCVTAYEMTRDPELLDGAQKWARHIRANLPATIGRRWRKEIFDTLPDAQRLGGAYADGYGRAILFFAHLYRATRDPRDLATAQQLADDALTKLSENGWIKGHAAKPYYEATDGVGMFLAALMDLAELA